MATNFQNTPFWQTEKGRAGFTQWSGRVIEAKDAKTHPSTHREIWLNFFSHFYTHYQICPYIFLWKFYNFYLHFFRLFRFSQIQAPACKFWDWYIIQTYFEVYLRCLLNEMGNFRVQSSLCGACFDHALITPAKIGNKTRLFNQSSTNRSILISCCC